MKATTITNPGGLEKNCDCICQAKENGIYCFAVADGRSIEGNIASTIAAQSIIERFKERPALSLEAVEDYLKYSFDSMRLNRSYNRERHNMSSSVAVFLTDEKKAVWGHLGDCRIYFFKRRRIREITSDHTAAFIDYENKETDYEGIRNNPNKERLLRCIGDKERFRPEITPFRRVCSKDAFLLCTDGFWNHVTEDDMEKSIKQADTPRIWLKDMLEIHHIDYETAANVDSYSAAAIFLE